MKIQREMDEHALAVAREIAAAAIEKINVWGRDVGDTTVLKVRAADSVNAAVREWVERAKEPAHG